MASVLRSLRSCEGQKLRLLEMMQDEAFAVGNEWGRVLGENPLGFGRLFDVFCLMKVSVLFKVFVRAANVFMVDLLPETAFFFCLIKNRCLGRRILYLKSTH